MLSLVVYRPHGERVEIVERNLEQNNSLNIGHVLSFASSMAYVPEIRKATVKRILLLLFAA